MDLQSLTHAAYRQTANGRTRSAEAPALLTAREREVLDGLAAGLSDREIALRATSQSI